MTFLKKLGSFLAQGIAIATGVWPLVSGLFGSNTKAQQTGTTIINDLTSIGQIVVQAEALIQQPGSGYAKLEAAAPLVANIVKTSELVAGHKIKNEALFIQAVSNLTGAVADILNSLDSGTVQSTGQVLPAIPVPVPVTSAPAPTTTAAPTPATGVQGVNQ